MRMPDGRWDPFDDYVIDFALERMRAGQRVALVTLAAIEGSSPRPLGAQMAVTEAGEWVGYLSGGCVERAVVEEAIAAIRAGENRRVRYGRGSKYMDIRLPCGSAIELDFDVTLGERALEAIDHRVRNRHTAFLETDGAPSLACETGEPRAYPPRLRLVVLGVGPAAVCLARLARAAGLDTLLGSPDAATRAAAEGVALLPLGMSAPANGIPADARTAIAFMFHDHEWERLLLPAALETPAFYIGALGSRRTQANRLRLLREAGTNEAQIARLRGPAGLFHGARSAQAIAVSILAEIMEADIRRAMPEDQETAPDIAFEPACVQASRITSAASSA
ncbi:XdhC family protein [Starkeya koreensis]|uniref:XdhC family protein n=1 Tax=Ancylobacter koreensis TaxID=266121 RepID=A0ABT0DRM1_9HYPH|nr:XdhC family protein [Ancylobacter koreensis]MCK0209931.1 XdhC family protein [Ancylobacter koreensis]